MIKNSTEGLCCALEFCGKVEGFTMTHFHLHLSIDNATGTMIQLKVCVGIFFQRSVQRSFGDRWRGGVISNDALLLMLKDINIANRFNNIKFIRRFVFGFFFQRRVVERSVQRSFVDSWNDS